MVSRLDYVPQSTFCTLKPLFFEVPNAANENIFIGRQWLFRETCEHLGSDLPTNRGLVIVGAPGTGKTTIVLQLVEHSCFGRASESSYQGKIAMEFQKKQFIMLDFFRCNVIQMFIPNGQVRINLQV